MQEVQSLPEAFLRALERHPQKLFLAFEGERYSYEQMHDQIARVAGHLRAWGLKRGERVALYLENSPSFITTYLAVLWLGGVVVPVNTRYRSSELAHILSDSGARLIVSDAAGSSALGQLQNLPENFQHIEIGKSLEDDLTLWQAFAAAAPLPEPLGLSADDLAVIGYTSGTTGRSKGAMLSHGNFVSNSYAVTKAWRWTPEDHLLLVLPLFHMHGLGVGLHGTLVQGSSLTLHRRFEAEAVFDALCKGEASMFFGVPTMHHRLLKLAEARTERPEGLRLLVSGSAPLSPQTQAAIADAFGLQILERYGMTETVMNLGNPYDGLRKPGTVGLPFEGVELRIINQEGKPVYRGETGELQLRGPNVCQGYWQRPDASEVAWTQDGWFKTGDLGFQDEDGYVTLSGRAKDLIISGGFNVYPREVEELLEQHPQVAAAAVIGLSDEDLGEKVVAVVVPNDPSPSAQMLLDFCQGKIAGFKKPKEVFFTAELPRNALGKVQKHRLREVFSTQVSEP